MPNRISRVVTRTGDRGETSLAGPERYPKHHPRLALIGALDEANSFVGLMAARISEYHKPAVTRIQSRLFDIGGAVATGGTAVNWRTARGAARSRDSGTEQETAAAEGVRAPRRRRDHCPRPRGAQLRTACGARVLGGGGEPVAARRSRRRRVSEQALRLSVRPGANGPRGKTASPKSSGSRSAANRPPAARRHARGQRSYGHSPASFSPPSFFGPTGW